MNPLANLTSSKSLADRMEETTKMIEISQLCDKVVDLYFLEIGDIVALHEDVRVCKSENYDELADMSAECFVVTDKKIMHRKIGGSRITIDSRYLYEIVNLSNPAQKFVHFSYIDLVKL